MKRVKRQQMSLDEIKNVVKDVFTKGQQGVEFQKKNQSYSICRVIAGVTEDYFVYGISSGNSPLSMKIALYESIYFIIPYANDPGRIQRMKDKYNNLVDKEDFIKKKVAVEKAKLIAQGSVSKSKEELKLLQDISKKEVALIRQGFRLSSAVDKIVDYVDAITDEKTKEKFLDLHRQMKEIIPTV